MSIQLAADIWNLVKDAIVQEDRVQFAETMVSLVMDEGYELDEISDAFSGDADVISAVDYYRSEYDNWREDDEDTYDDSSEW